MSGEPLYPYQYELIWGLLREPRRAADLAGWGRWRGMSAQGIAARLRPLVARGWIRQDGVGVYSVTERGRGAVSW